MCMFYFILNDRKWSWGGGFHTTGKYDIFLYRNVRHNIYVVCQCCHASVTGCNNNRYILMNHTLQKAVGLLSNRLSPKARPIAKNRYHSLLLYFEYGTISMAQYKTVVYCFLTLFAVSNMMTSSNGNIFRVTGHLWGEFTGPRRIPRTKASDAELWCFLWSMPK